LEKQRQNQEQPQNLRKAGEYRKGEIFLGWERFDDLLSTASLEELLAEQISPAYSRADDNARSLNGRSK
jgi:hypothetical protein